MAISTVFSNKELERIAAQAYEGKTVNFILCNVGSSGYNAETPIANWQLLEIAEPGYESFTSTLQSGAYSSELDRYVLPAKTAYFMNNGGQSFSYDRVIVYFENEDYPYAVIQEDSSISIDPGRIKAYEFTFRQRNLLIEPPVSPS